jgi:hypothetical protein
MHACSIEGRVIVCHSAEASVFGEWRKLVNIVRLGTTTMQHVRYEVVRFDTKSGGEKDAINSPAGAWLVSQEEAAALNLVSIA